MPPIIGDKLKNTKSICPICLHEDTFLKYMSSNNEKKSNNVIYSCPACQNKLVIKNSSRDLWIGFLGVVFFIGVGYFLSVTTLAIIAFAFMVIISVLVKKKIIDFSGTNFSILKE